MSETDAVIVRPAREADLDAVSALAASLVRLHAHWDPERFLPAGPGVQQGYRRFLLEELARDEALLLVAEDASDGAILGYAFGRREPRNWEMLMDESGVLHDVYVDDRARGRGVGALLVRSFVERMKSTGAARVVLHTAAQNAAGQALFKKLGFRVTMFEMTI